MTEPANTELTGGNARLSDDGLYRYYLTRYWGPVADASERICWLMLNPSTADASLDDPTIRRVRGFSQQWGFTGFAVVNLFAYRATEPTDLLKAEDPIGPENNEWINTWVRQSIITVAAWGASFPRKYEPYVAAKSLWLRKNVPGLHTLGHTKDGHPRHPLMLAANTPLQRWDA